jgi:hypothetical protein
VSRVLRRVRALLARLRTAIRWRLTAASRGARRAVSRGRDRREAGQLERRLAGSPATPSTRDGTTVWVTPTPPAPLAELRVEQLAAVVGTLQAAGVGPRVVPDPEDVAPQVAVASERFDDAVAALRRTLGPAAWYAHGVDRWSPLATWRANGVALPVRLSAWYALGDGPAVHEHVAITLVPWHLVDGRREATARNVFLTSVPADAFDEPATVAAHGGRWPSASPFTGRHPRVRPPGRWVVPVPTELGAADDDTAVAIAAETARAVWFAAPIGAEILIAVPRGIEVDRGGVSVPVVFTDGDDELSRLRELVTTSVDGACVVVPAGALPVRPLRPARLASPGGIRFVTTRRDRLDDRPLDVEDPIERETHALRDWFRDRTGRSAPWITQGVPHLLTAASFDDADLVDDPSRPSASTVEAALSVLHWHDHLAARAVPAGQRVSSRSIGDRVLERTRAAVDRPGRVEVVVIRRHELPRVDAAAGRFAELVSRRVPTSTSADLGSVPVTQR